MTKAEFLALRPNATALQIRANCEDAITSSGPPPMVRSAAAGRRKATRCKSRAGVERPRNGGAWSEARYWQAVRSALRGIFRFWRPAAEALLRSRRAAPGPRGAKWAFRCAGCGGEFRRRTVQIDHVKPCGTLREPGQIAGWLARLTPEDANAFQVLCRPCHKRKTARDRATTDAPRLGNDVHQ